MSRTARLYVEPLDVALGVGEVVRRLAERERVTAWSGRWSPGALVTCDPVRLAGPGADPFTMLTELPVVEPDPAHPGAVGGGWFGYLSFPATRPAAFPRFSLGYYRDLLRYDRGRWWYEALLTDGLDTSAMDAATTGDVAGKLDAGPDARFDAAAARRRCAALCADLAAPATLEPARLELRGEPDRTAHTVAVERCIQAIRGGEIYQANIACHVDAHLHGSPHDAWARLVEAHAPDRAALVADPAGTAVSASPELFLRRSGRDLRTAPIKGTRPRTGGPADATERLRLRASAKDAAENIMIVDLMRNDLARVSAIGTVRVPTLLEVEPHAGVWHLVSTVTGELAAGRDDADLLAATFPPGSVTGAPKHRAVQVIEALEGRPRGLFTGAMGWSSPLAGLEFNVAIRTLEVASDGRATLGVGGGVTVDSTPVEEWAECLTKAAPLLATLGAPPLHPGPGPDGPRLADRSRGIFETLLVVNGRPRALADHVRRLRTSYLECYGVPLTADVAAAVAQATASTGVDAAVPDRPEVVQAVAGANAAVVARPEVVQAVAGASAAVGTRRSVVRVRVEVRPGAPDRVRATARRWDLPVDLDAQPGLELRPYRLGPAGGERHKFADRRWLEVAEAGLGPGEAALLVDDGGVLLEGTRSCVFVVRAGLLSTPALDGRILPGTARRAVLDVLDAAGTPYQLLAPTLAELVTADGVFLVNAVRGVQWARAAPGVVWPEPDPVTRWVAKLMDRG